MRETPRGRRDLLWGAVVAFLREAAIPDAARRHECTLRPVSRLDIGMMERIAQDNINENARARLSTLTSMSAPVSATAAIGFLAWLRADAAEPRGLNWAPRSGDALSRASAGHCWSRQCSTAPPHSLIAGQASRHTRQLPSGPASAARARWRSIPSPMRRSKTLGTRRAGST
jgi:hypothetical protein